MLSADAVGGVWTYALELATGLAEQGIEVLVAVLGPPPAPEQCAAAERVAGLTLRHGDFPLEWMQDAVPEQAAAGEWLLALAREWKPDVVHLNHYGHGHLEWPAPALVVAHSCVGSWFECVRGEPAGPEWEGYRRLLARGLQGAPMVIAPTQAMLDATQRLYGPFRASRVIHNGRRAADFPAGDKAPHILSAGRLWDEAKNVGTLARIAGELPWPVRVAGDTAHPEGGDAAFEGVHLLGRLDPAAMARAYAQASIYALPARYEPFGLSALEAALAGCALVLGDIASLRELWNGAAVFVPPDDGAALAQALRGLIEDAPRRDELARRAHERALGYDSARMVARYLQTYSELVRPPEAA